MCFGELYNEGHHTASTLLWQLQVSCEFFVLTLKLPLAVIAAGLGPCITSDVANRFRRIVGFYSDISYKLFSTKSTILRSVFCSFSSPLTALIVPIPMLLIIAMPDIDTQHTQLWISSTCLLTNCLQDKLSVHVSIITQPCSTASSAPSNPCRNTCNTKNKVNFLHTAMQWTHCHCASRASRASAASSPSTSSPKEASPRPIGKR